MRVSEGIFDFFKKKEKTIGDSPEYKGWLKIYLKNPDVAAMHKNHKEFLQYFQQADTNEGFLDFLDWSGKEMEEQYIPWVEKALKRYGSQGTKRRMKKQFPDITALDIEKAIDHVLTRRADRS
jgi:hypothetical protein|tara:strand:+ start:134 stop:502 length:369 start_codon:yes stop_codon:yes gene_type:complete